MARQNVIEIVIKADGTAAVRGIGKVGKGMNALGDKMDRAGKRVFGFGKSLSGINKLLGAVGLGLSAIVFARFIKGAFDAAAAAERLGRATDNLAKGIGASGNAMVKSITQASNETISKVDAMKAANKAMLFGIVENEQEMAEMTQIAVALGAAMGQSATKSIDDMSTALGRNSPLILDNLGLSIKLTDSYRIYAASIGVSVDSLTEEQKAMAFRKAALIEGRKRIEELGGVTVDAAGQTEQLGAAWDDFTVALGTSMTASSQSVGVLTSALRDLEAATYEAQSAFEARHEVSLTFALEREAALGNAEAIKRLTEIKLEEANATLDEEIAALTHVEALLEEKTATELAAAAAERASVNGIRDADAHRLALNAMGETYRTVGKAAVEAARLQEEAINNLRLSQAGYYNSFNEWEDSRAENLAEFESKMADIRSGAASKQTDLQKSLAEKSEDIEKDRQEKLHWVMTGAHERTAEQNAEALAHWNAHYDELKADAEAKTQEKVDAVIAAESKAASAAASAREKEKAAMAEHLEELKLKTVLAMMETTGQLEQLTGLVGISASDAAELITSGLLPVTQQMGQAIQGTMGEMESSMEAAAINATANQEILQAAMAGTLTGTEDVATGMEALQVPVQGVTDAMAGIGGTGEGGAFGALPTDIETLNTEFSTTIPDNIALTDEALILLSESAITQLTPILEMLTAINTQFLIMYTVRLIALQAQTLVTTQIMIAAFTEVNVVLQETLDLLIAITDQLVQVADAMARVVEEGLKLKQVVRLWDDMLERMKRAIELGWVLVDVMKKITAAKQSAASTVGSRTGQGFHSGVGFQSGSPGHQLGLGWPVPPGFPNDSFLMGVTSREEVLVTPPGMSIEALIFDRLARVMASSGRTSNKTNNFNLTVNTAATAGTVLQDFRIMQALVGN
jgi:hypothetical protein